MLSRSDSLPPSARNARALGPRVLLASFNVFSSVPQITTRAPSRSNSWAEARPIPRVPPVIRMFLFFSFPIALLHFLNHRPPLAVCRHLNRCLISSERYDIQARQFASPENRSMRKSKTETAKTRERILEAATAQFLSHGITEAGLAPLMRAAGLTHGGFYRHFASKGQLVAETCSQAVLSLTSGLKSQIQGKPPRQALPLLVRKYLSRSHSDQPATRCVLSALGG